MRRSCSRDHVRVPAIGVAVALVPAGLSVPGAEAGAAARAGSGHPGRVAGGPALTGLDLPAQGPGMTLINFYLPGTVSPQAGQALREQCESQGVVFGPIPVVTPSDGACGEGVFYRDTCADLSGLASQADPDAKPV
jgi:hypothetical protein